MTTKPFEELHAILKEGNAAGSGISQRGGGLFSQNAGSGFIKSEEEQRQQLRTQFQQYDRAKLIFDAPIVQNLCIQDTREPEDTLQQLHRPNRDFEAKFSKRAESKEFRIILATQGNHIYYVSFDKYYLKKDETIFVEKSDDEFL